MWRAPGSGASRASAVFSCAIESPGQRPRVLPSLYSVRVTFLTFNRCGSQWVRDVLTDPEMLRPAGFRAIPGSTNVPGSVWNEALVNYWPRQPDRTFAGPLYAAPPSSWEAHRKPGDKALIVLRDPRDLIVSMAYSVAFSHPSCAVVDFSREGFQRLDRANRLALSAYLFYSPSAAFREWAVRPMQANEYRTSYETLIASGLEEFLRIVGFLGWRVPESTVARVVDRHSFKARSGRPRGDSDSSSHFRRAIPGDWKNHFDRQLGETFERYFPNLLVEAGYEASNAWYLALSKRARYPRAFADSRKAHTLREELARAREEALQLHRVCAERLAYIEQQGELSRRHIAIIEDLKARLEVQSRKSHRAGR